MMLFMPPTPILSSPFSMQTPLPVRKNIYCQNIYKLSFLCSFRTRNDSASSSDFSLRGSTTSIRSDASPRRPEPVFSPPVHASTRRPEPALSPLSSHASSRQQMMSPPAYVSPHRTDPIGLQRLPRRSEQVMSPTSSVSSARRSENIISPPTSVSSPWQLEQVTLASVSSPHKPEPVMSPAASVSSSQRPRPVMSPTTSVSLPQKPGAVMSPATSSPQQVQPNLTQIGYKGADYPATYPGRSRWEMESTLSKVSETPATAASSERYIPHSTKSSHLSRGLSGEAAALANQRRLSSEAAKSQSSDRYVSTSSRSAPMMRSASASADHRRLSNESDGFGSMARKGVWEKRPSRDREKDPRHLEHRSSIDSNASEKIRPVTATPAQTTPSSVTLAQADPVSLTQIPKSPKPGEKYVEFSPRRAKPFLGKSKTIDLPSVQTTSQNGVDMFKDAPWKSKPKVKEQVPPSGEKSGAWQQRKGSLDLPSSGIKDVPPGGTKEVPPGGTNEAPPGGTEEASKADRIAQYKAQRRKELASIYGGLRSSSFDTSDVAIQKPKPDDVDLMFMRLSRKYSSDRSGTKDEKPQQSFRSSSHALTMSAITKPTSSPPVATVSPMMAPVPATIAMSNAGTTSMSLSHSYSKGTSIPSPIKAGRLDITTVTTATKSVVSTSPMMSRRKLSPTKSLDSKWDTSTSSSIGRPLSPLKSVSASKQAMPSVKSPVMSSTVMSPMVSSLIAPVAEIQTNVTSVITSPVSSVLPSHRRSAFEKGKSSHHIHSQLSAALSQLSAALYKLIHYALYQHLSNLVAMVSK